MKRARILEVVDGARRKYSGLNITVEDWRLTLFEASTARNIEPITKNYFVGIMSYRSRGTQLLADISDYFRSRRFKSQVNPTCLIWKDDDGGDEL